MSWVYIILGAFLLFIIKLHEKTLISPASIIVVCWCFFPAIACFYPYWTYPFSFETHVCIFLSLFSFLFVFFLNTKRTSDNQLLKQKDSIIGEVNNKWLIILNIIVALWLFQYVTRAWGNIIFSGWSDQRGSFREYFDTSTLTIYEVFAKPIIIATCAIMSVELFSGKEKINLLLVILLFVNLLQESIVFAARASIVKAIFFVLFSFLFIALNRGGQSFKNRIIPLLVLAILIGGVNFITKGRNENSGTGIVETIFIYYMAPFGMLNYYLVNPDFSLLGFDYWLCGKAILGFIHNFIMAAGYVLMGWDYKSYGSDYAINEVTHQFVEVSPDFSMNAAVTADYIFLRDFGYLGIIIGFALSAFVVCKIRNYYNIKHSLRAAAIYLFLLYTTMRLSIWYDFINSSAMMTVIYIVLLTKNNNRDKVCVGTTKA